MLLARGERADLPVLHTASEHDDGGQLVLPHHLQEPLHSHLCRAWNTHTQETGETVETGEVGETGERRGERERERGEVSITHSSTECTAPQCTVYIP